MLFLRLSALLLLVFSTPNLLGAASPAAGDTLDGEWRLDFGKGKIDQFVFTFNCEGGKLTGEVQRGNEGSEPIREGTCSEDKFEFQVSAGSDVWIWSGNLIPSGRLRCHRQKQGKEMRQTFMAVR